MNTIKHQAAAADLAGTGETWIAIFTNPRCEKRAADGLRAKGIRVFVPEEIIWRKRRSRGSRRERTRRPLFPRYAFVGLKRDKRGDLDFFSVRSVDGVERIVGINGCPVTIPAVVVSELMYAEISGFFDKTDERPPLEPGQTVRVGEGPFKNFLGKVQRADSYQRVEILLDVFGRESTAVVDFNLLRAA